MMKPTWRGRGPAINTFALNFCIQERPSSRIQADAGGDWVMTGKRDQQGQRKSIEQRKLFDLI